MVQLGYEVAEGDGRPRAEIALNGLGQILRDVHGAGGLIGADGRRQVGRTGEMAGNAPGGGGVRNGRILGGPGNGSVFRSPEPADGNGILLVYKDGKRIVFHAGSVQRNTGDFQFVRGGGNAVRRADRDFEFAGRYAGNNRLAVVVRVGNYRSNFWVAAPPEQVFRGAGGGGHGRKLHRILWVQIGRRGRVEVNPVDFVGVCGRNRDNAPCGNGFIGIAGVMSDHRYRR